MKIYEVEVESRAFYTVSAESKNGAVLKATSVHEHNPRPGLITNVVGLRSSPNGRARRAPATPTTCGWAGGLKGK